MTDGTLVGDLEVERGKGRQKSPWKTVASLKRELRASTEAAIAGA
jgi:hypothetical protein